jgi:hypothetical protein
VRATHRPLAIGALAAALSGIAALAGIAAPARAVGSAVGSLDIVSRADRGVLTTYASDGRHWVVGTPGQEYALRLCNRTAGRVLAVPSVDGVNVITGDTASPAQSGYVLDPYQCYDIDGWRKSLSRTAAFYFTELPDSYAARTGRPANVGVIGVAFFREKPQRTSWSAPWGRVAPERADAPGPRSGDTRALAEAARQESASGVPAADAASTIHATEVAPRARGAEAASHASVADAAPRSPAADAAPHSSAADAASAAPTAPAPLAKLGTGHGRSQTSHIDVVSFEREGERPSATIAIHYDRRENLIAMGILPAPKFAGSPNPFPAWRPRFAPDPPTR